MRGGSGVCSPGFSRRNYRLVESVEVFQYHRLSVYLTA